MEPVLFFSILNRSFFRNKLIGVCAIYIYIKYKKKNSLNIQINPKVTELSEKKKVLISYLLLNREC